LKPLQGARGLRICSYATETRVMFVQDVADDADAPHVGGVVDRVEADDLGRHELGRAEHDARLGVRVVVARQTEVDDLDPIAALTETQDVLRLVDHNTDRNE